MHGLNTENKKAVKVLFLILGIVILTFVILAGVLFAIFSNISHEKCGEGGKYSYSSDRGGSCVYDLGTIKTIPKEGSDKCPSCDSFCQEKDREKIMDAHSMNVPISSIKFTEGRGYSLNEVDIYCRCICTSKSN